MIVESIVAGITIITVSSLLFTNALIKRQREWDKEDYLDPADKEETPSLIKPFIEVAVGTNCPVCGRAAEPRFGLRHPKACNPKDKCDEPSPHLHVECTWCESKWLMEPASK